MEITQGHPFARLATALSATYPGEEWGLDIGRGIIVNKAGVTLAPEDIARCENGTDLAMLIEHKRDARRVVMLDAALSWVDLSQGQASAKMGSESPKPGSPHAHAAKEQHG